MRILDLPHGIHERVPEDVYHQRVPGLVSKHALDLVHRAPAAYKAWVEGQEEEVSEALALGKAFHCALLEPQRFEEQYAVLPQFGDCRKKENKANRDAWLAEHQGATFIEASDMATVRGMVRAVYAHPLAGRMLTEGAPELTLRWRDEATELECKARPDYYVRRMRMVVDVKSARDASFEEFRRAAARYGYHRQDAHYRAGMAAVGEPIDHFVFVVVETKAPHLIALYSLDADGVARGYGSIRRDMDTLAECLELDKWPGYELGIQTLDLPPWAA